MAEGARAYGFSGSIWTRKRVGVVIEENFGVSYCEPHLGRILAAMGFTRQKPGSRDPRQDFE